VLPVIAVPLSVKLELANAVPVHLVTALVDNEAAPEIEAVTAVEPL